MGIRTMHYVDVMTFNSEVTGSCILCNVRFPDDRHVKFLVDCGMYQEKANEVLNGKFEFKPESIDFVLITHTHVDHIGRLPLLEKQGYRNPIYMSGDAANHLIGPALWDCQRVLQSNSSVKAVPPIYGEKEVEETLKLTKGMPYSEKWSPAYGIDVTFFKNAHVPGAVIIFVQTKCEGYSPVNLLFTGDYNDKSIFFCNEEIPQEIRDLPMNVIQEATYGTTDSYECVPRFEQKITEVLRNSNDVLLLAYSFGRTQEVLYNLKCMQDKGILSTSIPIYLDGRLGINYTKTFPELDSISEEMREFIPKNLIFVCQSARETVVESKEKKIVVTSSGTGSYGPAQFYLPYFLANPKAYVGFTGYTPANTLGSKLQTIKDGESVKVGGVVVKKRAEVDYFSEFSAHAKADTLLNFLRGFSNLRMVLINHGEPEKKFKYAERVEKEINVKMVGILDRDYWFRVDHYGYVKSVPTKFL